MATAGLAALLAVSLPVNWHYLFGQSPSQVAVPASVGALVGGHLTAAVAENYNKGFLLRDTGIDLFGTLSWTLFHEGRKGVLAGSDGWLFTAEEFETGPRSAKAVAKAAGFVADVKAKLAAAGTDLIIALVPAKATIYPEELGRYRLPAEPARRYDRLLGLFSARGIAAPDLRPLLREAKDRGPTYLRTDTHWTPFGARTVARAIADAVAGRDLGAEKTFTEHDLPVADHSGDLMRYVRVAGFAGSLAPLPDRLESFDAVAAEGGSLLGDDTVPVTLVGTSYSANQKWSFEAALEIALGRDVLNVAAEGKGPFQPMSDYLRSDTFKSTPPKLVVWEIPERFVDDDYDQSAFRLE
jgi:alginate O-acetyltransferase complex protein AlgJ